MELFDQIQSFIKTQKDESTPNNTFKQHHENLRSKIEALQQQQEKEPQDYYALSQLQFLMAQLLYHFPDMYFATFKAFSGQTRAIINNINALTNLNNAEERANVGESRTIEEARLKYLTPLAYFRAYQPVLLQVLPKAAKDKFAEHEAQLQLIVVKELEKIKGKSEIKTSIRNEAADPSCCNQFLKATPILAGLAAGTATYLSNFGICSSVVAMVVASSLTEQFVPQTRNGRKFG